MKFQEHPTWIMLEEAKHGFRDALNEVNRFSALYDVLKQGHDSMVKLQYEVENKILQSEKNE